MIRAGKVRAVEMPLPERTAMVNAGAVEGIDGAFEVTDGERPLSHEDFHHFAAWQVRNTGDIDQGHIFQ
jgi:hypothetical protein